MGAVDTWFHHLVQAWRTASRPALRTVVVLASLAAVVLYLVVVVSRIRYPYELEWMEGGMVDHVARVLRGEPIYIRPGLRFTPFVYPPLFYYLSAASASAFGLGFFSLRLVSVVSSLVSFVLLACAVRRETRSWTASAAALGVLAGAYPMSGGWFDVGRVDSLFLALVLGGVWVARRFESVAGAAVSASLFALALHTKQSALVPAGSVALALTLASRRRALAFSVVLAGTVVASSFLLEKMSGGWFGFYTVAVVRGHALVSDMLVIFWRDEVLRPWGFAVALSLCFLLLPTPALRRDTRAFYGIVGAGLIATAWLSRIHSGAWFNVLVPAHLALAFGAGFGVHVLLEAGDGFLARRGAAIGVLAFVVQLGTLAYDPAVFIPTAADKLAGDGFLQRLRATPGEVLLTHHGYLPSLAGKPTFAHHMAVIDVMRSTADVAGAKQGLRAEFDAALRTHRFSVVVIDNGDSPFMPDIERAYRLSGRWTYPSANVFYPRTGAHIRPDVMFVPRGPWFSVSVRLMGAGAFRSRARAPFR